MSKNLTRKGLALGAVVALASTVIAGSPAFAAGELNVAPSAGTSLNIASGSVFNLKTTLAAGFTPASYAQLKYIIKTDANSAITYDVGVAAVTDTSANAQAVSLSSAAVVATGATSTTVNYLGLSADTTTVTSNVEVTAFVDANNDGALTAGEWNTVKTVSFKKAADIVPVVSLTAPATGDTTVKATVAWGDLNIEQMSAETVKFTVGSQATTSTAVTLTDGVWAPTAALTALAAAEAVTAQAYNGATALGAVASATASARTINTANGLVSNVSAGTDSVATAATVVAADTAATVRTNGSYTVQVKASDIAAGATTASTVAKSGVAVVATIATSATLSATAGSVVSITANGVTYNTAAGLSAASIALTTDAAGLANVTISTAGFVAGKTVTVTFKSQNLTSAVVATAADAAFTVVSTGVGSALRTITEGGSATLNYVVKDQFGVAIGAGARLSVAIGYTTPATVYVPVSGGAASVTVTDTTASTETAITAIATLQTQDVATSNWAAATTPIVAATQTVNVSAVATTFDTVPVAQSIALSTSVALTTASVTNAGAAVTISSKGVTFVLGGVDYVDTITLFAGTSGDIVVNAKSDIAGAKTITYTAGSETKTSVVTVAAAAQTSGTVLTLDAPASILPGRTLLVSGKLVDKFGNPVDITSSAATLAVVYTGPGLIVGSLPTETDASGTFSFRVLMGANETGSASVSASYDSNGATTDVAGTTVVVTVAKTITIEAAAAVTASVAGIKGFVATTVRNASGKAVTVTVNGRVLTPRSPNVAAQLFKFRAKAGKTTVVVKVDGVTVSSRTVTVKK